MKAQEFSRKDSLQGGLREERTCYDVLRYDLDIRIDPEKKWIFGSNTITFKVDDDTNKIQVDLFENMIIDGIRLDNIPKIECTREFNAVFIHFPKILKKGETHKLRISYYGNPVIAKMLLGMVVSYLQKIKSKILGLVWLCKELVRVYGIRVKIRKPMNQIMVPA
jgi:aminopeptidase N